MFTQSWEDPACDVAAMAPRAGETLLCITSGGDNAFGFLLTDPARVITIDINPAQTYLLELKIAAFQRLRHADLLAFFGVRPGPAARSLYESLRLDLSTPAAEYWDRHAAQLERGLLVSGAFERYFAVLRGALRFIVGRRRMERLFDLAPDEQREFYDREWNTWRWRALIRLGCSKWFLGRRLDPSFFTHVGGVRSFGAHFHALAAHAIGSLPARTNYFLAQILLGRYLDEAAVPDYLRAENFERIRARLHCLVPVTADIADALAALSDASVDTFALSNVFEYSPPAVFERAKGELRRVGRPGARISLRNLLVPYRLGDDPWFDVDPRLSERLRLADRAFIYSHFEAARLRSVAA